MASILATGCFSMEVVGRGVRRKKTEWGRWESVRTISAGGGDREFRVLQWLTEADRNRRGQRL